ncbi:TonB-dependent receptor domain-containing protein [Aquidulcibacter sp.]|uniref:TonB-dependent receptor domain-containing protein n=1 Tax=Aquidulcibacter sp. TaxID=2052990 RepID=UPI0037C19537
MKISMTRELLLASTIVAGLGFAAPAFAQTAAAATEPQAVETVVVTGSRLRREVLDLPNPTLVVGVKELDDKVLANVGDAIEDIPLMGNGSNARGTQTQNGDSFILPDVLDLGTNRTLTLVNGRRMQPSLPATNFVPGNTTGSQVDLSTINPALIQRVEVIAGTGGAIYGADAVGGVVNLILKDNFEGATTTFSAGATELGGGQQGRFTGLVGKNLLNGRGNITASVDYFSQAAIFASDKNAARYLGSGILNPFNGGVRNPESFSAASAADLLRSGGTLPVSFLSAATDGISSTFFGPLTLASRVVSVNGVLVTRHGYSGGFSNTNQIVPSVPINPGISGRLADPQGFSFFAPTGLPAGVSALAVINSIAPGTNLTGLTAAQQTALAVNLLQRNRPTPLEWFKNNPNVDPLLLIGTFGTFSNLTSTAAGVIDIANGYFPTITNTDAATALLFPRRAVPLQFNSAGDLVPYNIGTVSPTNPGLFGSGFGSDGYDSTKAGHSQIQAGTERFSFGATSKFEIADFLNLRTELQYSTVDYEQIGGAPGNSTTGNAAAGTFAIPVYLDQNPYVSGKALATIADLSTKGFVVPVVNGQRTLFINRALTDLFDGGLRSTSSNETFRVMNALEGNFKLLDRAFYYEVAGIYGRAKVTAQQQDVSDIAFALAVDPVVSNGQIVCRQQTLTAPESITVRNPGITSGLTTVSLVPSAADVAACKPLNLIGSQKISRADADRILVEQRTDAENTLTSASASLGGQLYKLPAGWMQLGVQAEKRTEAAEYITNRTLKLGLGRNATQGDNKGRRDFVEYGYETNIPVFGEDFNFPLLRQLDLAYAWRIVERSQSSPFASTSGADSKDDTFNYSVNYKPINDLSLRSATSRTVRSPSIIELFDPGLRAFGGLSSESHPCSIGNIGAGPNPSVRRANCVKAVQLLGIAANEAASTAFLASFNPATAPNRPAVAVGNPFLGNEEANTTTFGATYSPSFIPRLVISVDYFQVKLKGELGLVGTPTTTNACFDSAAFPNSIVGAANPACDAILFAVPGPGGFVVPSVNALTGRTTPLTIAYGGQQASPNSAFEIAAIDFLNLNLASRELESMNWEVRYNFGLKELPFVGNFLEKAGNLFLRGTVYHTQRYERFTPALDIFDKEHGNPEFKTRLDVRHTVGGFEHTLQWFWQSETVSNIQLTTPVADQSPAFVSPEFNYFNYFASYKFENDLTLRLSVNNVLDTIEPRGIYGVGNDFDGGVGREFLVSLTTKF